MSVFFLIPVFPALGFLALLFLPRARRNRLIALGPILVGISAVLAVVGFIRYFPGRAIGQSFANVSWTLARLGGTKLTLSFGLDSLALVMLTMVSVVGLCVQIYSLFYMKDDERRGWYFCVLLLFTAAMLALVTSGNLLLIFAMWEIMGVCSYLLIGFWYKDEAPRRASVKAFLVTRAGDLGFFIALAAIWQACGSFQLETIIKAAPQFSAATVLVIGIGLLWAAAGKSAQLPLSVWLPDAMAGPTPASAIIHAATMVAAGIFVIARMMPVISLSHVALSIALWVGIATAVFGAFLACFQTDIKRMLAFSTISQLGLMFAALGTGAIDGALFHLITHAFFKSLLFLAAGTIIHVTGTQDMRKMGGLAKHMPIMTTIFSIGAFALAGIVPLSGFFSKDLILEEFLTHGHPVAFALALVMATLTALYVVKAWFTIFVGKYRQEGHVHEGTLLEIIPTAILACFTLLLGIFNQGWLGCLGFKVEMPTMEMASISTGVMLVGATLGYLMYRFHIDNDWLAEHAPGFLRATEARLYTDAFYEYVIIKPYFGISKLLWNIDTHVIDGAVNGVVALYGRVTKVADSADAHVIDGAVNGVAAGYKHLTAAAWVADAKGIDGAVNGIGTGLKQTSQIARKAQAGRIHVYQRAIVGAVIVLLIIVLFVVLKGVA
ncbi:MAG: NADH-quinone oxidoreductase subunit L [Coriobacteriia bacterium]|nr:NADH-quinone oxidoreductase subunit L [Coriobacteriia bacterium]